MPNQHKQNNAWAWKKNFHQLLYSPNNHLKPIDGLRALSILGILLCHTVFFWDFLLSKAQYKQLLSSPIPRLMLFGELSVDLFFVISGFLIARILFHDHDTHQTLHIKIFYIRRFMRLLPVYIVTLALFCLWIRYNCHMSWTNLLYINNFIPLKQQCMASGWSLAIEEQFYSIFPWFLLLFMMFSRARLWILLALLLLAFGIRLWIITSSSLPIPLLFSMKNPSFVQFFDLLYDKPYTRYASLLCGILIAFLLQYTQTLDKLKRSPHIATTLLIVGLGLCISILCVPRHHTSTQLLPRHWAVLYLASHRILFAVGASLILLLSHLETGPAGWMRTFLSSKLWYPIAQLSYSTYLLHPIVIDRLYHALPHRIYSTPELLLLFLLNTTLSLVAAAIAYLAIERPIMNLRPHIHTKHHNP